MNRLRKVAAERDRELAAIAAETAAEETPQLEEQRTAGAAD